MPVYFRLPQIMILFTLSFPRLSETNTQTRLCSAGSLIYPSEVYGADEQTLFPLHGCWNIHVSLRKNWRHEGKLGRPLTEVALCHASLQRYWCRRFTEAAPAHPSHVIRGFIFRTLAFMIALDSQNKMWFSSKANQYRNHKTCPVPF